jgi:hypothetical protein
LNGLYGGMLKRIYPLQSRHIARRILYLGGLILEVIIWNYFFHLFLWYLLISNHHKRALLLYRLSYHKQSYASCFVQQVITFSSSYSWSVRRSLPLVLTEIITGWGLISNLKACWTVNRRRFGRWGSVREFSAKS